MSANTKLLIPKSFKFLGKDQPTLYKEATSKKPDGTTTTTTTTTTTIPKHFGKVIPLIGSDGTTNQFTAMDALDEAKKQGKILASLKDSDPYVLKNGGVYWTGEAILYPAPDQKFGSKLTYTDGNKVNYECSIPSRFQNEKGDKALIIAQGYFNHDTSKQYFEFKQQASGIWTLQINNPDELARLGVLRLVPILRNDGWHETDANMVPNGAASDKNNPNARYFWQVDNGSYLGLLRRGGVVDRLIVNAYGGPSGRYGVLAYE